MQNKKIIIVGAGPGGLTAGMLLSSKGYEVEIYESGRISANMIIKDSQS